MWLRWRILLVCSLFVGSVAQPHLQGWSDDSVQENVQGIEFFERNVRPILADRCYECHSGTSASGGLLLDSREALRQGGDSGPAIVEGQPDQSLLITAVSYTNPDIAMPPTDHGGKLSDSQIESLRQWIGAGAPDPRVQVAKLGGMTHDEALKWWAFQPVCRPTAPVSNRPSSSSLNEIDGFIDEQLATVGLVPLEQADPRTLVRRLVYDMTGLPPDAQTVERFVTDPSETAYAQLVEQLLDSPQYGIRWGRHWLDLVRYADTAGENTDRPLPHMWRYRNWVFDAFNRDMPFDEFVRLQLAGDIIRANEAGDRYTEGIIATGYLALARRFGHDIDQDVHLMHEDVIDNLGKTFLGLTVSCARCHDHKYDPIEMRDYYALYGIFENSRFSFSGCEAKGQPRDLVPLLSPEDMASLNQQWQDRRMAFDRKINELDGQTEVVRQAWQQGVSPQAIDVVAGEVAEGSEASLNRETIIDIRRGEMLLLVVSPQENHGADSTLVEWSISEVDGMGRTWSTRQLVDDLLVGNPRVNAAEPTQADELPVWTFLDWKRGVPDLLGEAVDGINGNASLKGWRNGDTPSAFVNSSGEPITVWTTLPARSFFVHPGSEGPVAIAWISPIEGQVEFSGRLADAHPGGPNGVAFQVQHIASNSAYDNLHEIVALQQARTKLIAERDQASGPPPESPVAFAVVEAEREKLDTRLHLRGDPTNPGEPIPRGWIGVLGGERLQNATESGRRELAEWIIRHPLAARVYVNRIWQQHFGRGLVRTPNDFGSRGELPTHPELLEWLTTQFLDSGGSTKELHRLIVHSAAYRRASAGAGVLAEVDPDNRYLARFDRRRLTAEELRDSLLNAANNLDLSIAGPHPFPPEASWTYTQHTPFNAVYDNRLRTAFQMVQRQRRHPFLALFDGADPNASTATRQLTTAPTQALYFLNDPFFHEHAQTLATLITTRDGDTRQRLVQLYQTLFQRTPDGAELDSTETFLASYPGAELERWSALCRVLSASNEFIMVD